ncbi:unnamed protein product [Orchesella dallaii]|uniref:Uncharacterized protein n=1 Tax=Orchesella dallaii TaxID=48710 RepID=A0ABP1RU83_9HEXA
MNKEKELVLVKKDFGMAAEWFKKAAENGSGEAANALANLYFSGSGSPKDPKQGHHYLNLAVKLDLSSRSTKIKACNSDSTSDSDSAEISQSSELSSDSGETFDMEGGILETKPRRVLITQPRQLISKMVLFNKDDVNADLGAFGVTQHPPSLTPCPPRTWSRVCLIFLKEMEFTSADHIYKDRLIDLTVIDVPNFKLPMAHLIVEDLNGDVTLLFLKQEKCKKSIIEKLKFGQKIAILNPYMQIGNGALENGLRVDDRRCLISLGMIEEMCRFCGEKGAKRKGATGPDLFR